MLFRSVEVGDQAASADVDEPVIEPGARVKGLRPKAATAARRERGAEPKKTDLGRAQR